jgi:hypothetical protein
MAVEFALQQRDLQDRIEALGSVAVALAGVVVPYQETDPLLQNR